MKDTEIGKFDKGIITNLPSNRVRIAAGRNVRFKQGSCYKTKGKELLATVPSLESVRAIFAFKPHESTLRHIVCCDTKIYSYTSNFSAYTDITPVPAPAGTNHTWHMALIGAMPVLTNGAGGLWKWNNFSSAMTSLTCPITNVSTIATFANRLIIGGGTRGGQTLPARLHWSGIANPQSWDLDAIGASGYKDFVSPNSNGIDADDYIRAISSTPAAMYIFCDRSVWQATPTASGEDFVFTKISSNKGIIGGRAFVETHNTVWYMGTDEFYSTGEKQEYGFNIWNEIFPNVNKLQTSRIFAFYHPTERELWWCVPTSTGDPDTAYVYQLDTGAWSILDCDFYCYGKQLSTYNDSPTTQELIDVNLVGGADGKIYQLDSTENNNGIAIDGYIETGDMDFGNSRLYKMIVEIVPKFVSQTISSPITVEVGTRDSLHQDIVWSFPQTCILGVSEKLDFRDTGKYVRLKISSDTTDSPWELDSINIMYSLLGRY